MIPLSTCWGGGGGGVFNSVQLKKLQSSHNGQFCCGQQMEEGGLVLGV